MGTPTDTVLCATVVKPKSPGIRPEDSLGHLLKFLKVDNFLHRRQLRPSSCPLVLGNLRGRVRCNELVSGARLNVADLLHSRREVRERRGGVNRSENFTVIIHR